jgi:glycosyltransferase involved in cell wall biosynthesis
MSEAADRPTLSIIIPTLNDAPHLAATIGHALIAAGADKMEFIITDFGSTDETLSRARQLKVKTIAGSSCKVDAMNRGVALASSEALLFLPPQARLPDFFDLLIERALRPSIIVGGAFEFGIIPHPRWTPVQRAWYGMISVLQHSRYRWGGHVCRDAAIFVRRKAFDTVGGFHHDVHHPADRMFNDLRRLGEVAIVRPAAEIPARSFTFRIAIRYLFNELGFHAGLPSSRGHSCSCRDLQATSDPAPVTIRSTTNA